MTSGGPQVELVTPDVVVVRVVVIVVVIVEAVVLKLGLTNRLEENID